MFKGVLRVGLRSEAAYMQLAERGLIILAAGWLLVTQSRALESHNQLVNVWAVYCYPKPNRRWDTLVTPFALKNTCTGYHHSEQIGADQVLGGTPMRARRFLAVWARGRVGDTFFAAREE